MAAFRGPASVSGAAAAADSASWVAAIALCDEGDVPVPPDDRGQRATASDPRVLHAANVWARIQGLKKQAGISSIAIGRSEVLQMPKKVKRREKTAPSLLKPSRAPRGSCRKWQVCRWGLVVLK